MAARRMYEREGYVSIEDGEQGEYEPQKGYKCMRRLEGMMEPVETGDAIRIIECGASEAVPRAVWMWMEDQIREDDGGTRGKRCKIY